MEGWTGSGYLACGAGVVRGGAGQRAVGGAGRHADGGHVFFANRVVVGHSVC